MFKKQSKLKMLSMTFLLLVIITCVVALFVHLFLIMKNKPPQFSNRYRDESSSTHDRVEDLLSQMTLKEKIGQMALVEKNSILSSKDISEYGIGAVLSGAGAKPEDNTPAGWRTMVSDITIESQNSRLGIPALYGVDAIHGHGNVPGATIFPHSIGLGASGDRVLVEKVARATAEELLATGIRWSYSPTLDVVEDIRWGRTYETFSSDPNLVGRLASAYVTGLQEESSGVTKNIEVLATAKHFIGAGGMQWGHSSNKNFFIDQGETPVDEKKLRDIYLPPFSSVVDEGVLSVMAGLNSWGDTKMAAEKHLLTDVLKGELGFKGFVVSDWYGVYEMPGSDFENTVVAVNAGVDMVMLPFDYKSFINNTSIAVALGLIPQSRIDDAVRRILYTKFKLGLFDDKKLDVPLATVGSDSHRALARQAVSESMVLLKNKDSVLPILQTTKRIHVAGSAADNVGKQSGAWTVEWQGVNDNSVLGGTSILKGLEQGVGNNTDIVYAENGTFDKNEKEADIGIAVVGESPYAEGWGDSDKLTLSEADLQAIENLRKNSKKIVVVLVTGRPLIITDEIAKWDGLAVAWLPGSEGAGVADALLGTKSFGGTLPLSWPRTIEQLPIDESGNTKDGTALLFERGFGLTTK